jgi:hypothetical protein
LAEVNGAFAGANNEFVIRSNQIAESTIPQCDKLIFSTRSPMKRRPPIAV